MYMHLINPTNSNFCLPIQRDEICGIVIAIVSYRLVYLYSANYWWCRRLGCGSSFTIWSEKGMRRGGYCLGEVVLLH